MTSKNGMQTTRYKAIFFDWGGVIARDPGNDFLEMMLHQLGATDDQIKHIFATYKIDFMRGKISEKEYWNALRREYGLVVHDDISHEFKKWKGLEVDTIILGLAAQAKSMGIKIAVLSNIFEPTYNVIKEAGLYDMFDEVIASCKVGYAKPDEEIYHLALERLGVTPQESVFIDDKLRCLEPAEKLGFTTIHAQNHEQLAHDLRELLQQQANV